MRIKDAPGKFFVRYKTCKWIILAFVVFGCFNCHGMKIERSSHYLSTRELLRKDYCLLLANNPCLFEKLERVEIEKLFYKGLKESVLFLHSFHKKKPRRNYRSNFKKSLAFFSQNDKIRHKVPKKVSGRIQKPIFNEPESVYRLFTDFRGKWAGKWKNDYVEQYWLSPRYCNDWLKLFGDSIKLNSFQTVDIGDGLGWNYQITLDGKNYVIGFTFHMDMGGNVIMKRPHIGIPQGNNYIVWITKDHLYFEFVCKSIHCSDLPLHYAITGVQYQYLENDFIINEGFQAIYLEK